MERRAQRTTAETHGTPRIPIIGSGPLNSSIASAFRPLSFFSFSPPPCPSAIPNVSVVSERLVLVGMAE